MCGLDLILRNLKKRIFLEFQVDASLLSDLDGGVGAAVGGMFLKTGLLTLSSCRGLRQAPSLRGRCFSCFFLRVLSKDRFNGKKDV